MTDLLTDGIKQLPASDLRNAMQAAQKDFVNLRIVNISTLTGYSIELPEVLLAVWPGQYVAKERLQTEEPAAQPLGGGYPTRSTKYTEVAHVVDTHFMLIGVPRDCALLQQVEANRTLTIRAEDLREKFQKLDIAHGVTVESLALTEAELGRARQRSEVDSARVQTAEKVLGDMRQRLDKLTKAFGKVAVDAALAAWSA